MLSMSLSRTQQMFMFREKAAIAVVFPFILLWGCKTVLLFHYMHCVVLQFVSDPLQELTLCQ